MLPLNLKSIYILQYYPSLKRSTILSYTVTGFGFVTFVLSLTTARYARTIQSLLNSRWAERYRLAEVNIKPGQLYDWEQHIAEEGFLLIAARVRQAEEAATVLTILQKVFKKTVDPANLFSLHDQTSTVTRPLLTKLLRQVVSYFILCLEFGNFCFSPVTGRYR